MSTQALDRLGYGGVDLLGQADHEDQGLNIAVSDPAAEGTQDAPDECGVLVVLDLPPRTFWCQPGLDSVRHGGLPELASLFGEFQCLALILVEALGVGPVNPGAGDAVES